MDTTTIRVDVETHAALAALSSARGATLMQTVRDAAEALRRQRFAQAVGVELAALRASPSAWDDYLVEADSTTVADGLD